MSLSAYGLWLLAGCSQKYSWAPIGKCKIFLSFSILGPMLKCVRYVPNPHNIRFKFLLFANFLDSEDGAFRHTCRQRVLNGLHRIAQLQRITSA